MKNIVLKSITAVAFCGVFIGSAAIDGNMIVGCAIVIISLLWILGFTTVNNFDWQLMQ